MANESRLVNEVRSRGDVSSQIISAAASDLAAAAASVPHEADL